jgi:chromosome segregation ATPase
MMTASSGTPLYVQVEDAIKEFKTSVQKLRDQQSQTDGMLVRGTEALGNMVNQVALMDKLKEEVERELHLMEQYRSTISQDYAEQQAQVDRAVANLKTTIDIRRQEMLGMVRELRQAQQKSEQDLNQKLADLQLSLNSSTTDLKASLKTLAKLQNNTTTELFSKLETLEANHSSRLRQSTWVLVAVAVVAIVAIIVALS